MRAHDSGLRTVADELCGESARALSEAVARSAEVSSRLLIDASLLIGPPALAVTDSGAGALMLVVGARGAGGFAAMLLGSVSRYAAMHASCPVIVVREGQASHVRPEVVVGIRDPQDTATLAFAFDEAELTRGDPGRRPLLERAPGRDLAASRPGAARGGGGHESGRGPCPVAGQVPRP